MYQFILLCPSYRISFDTIPVKELEVVVTGNRKGHKVVSFSNTIVMEAVESAAIHGVCFEYPRLIPDIRKGEHQMSM